MCSKKPTNLEEYRKWLKENHNSNVSRKTSNHYDAVALKVRQDFENSLFWKELTENLQTYNEKYLLQTSYPLFSGSEKITPLHLKSFDSFFLKTYRNNVVRNKNWPNQPNDGWEIPPNWISQCNDIVRTCFVVKYLDGVEFLINALEELAVANSQDFWKYYKQ